MALHFPLKILFAGIDGSGKTTCLDLLLSRLSSRYRILKVGPNGLQLFCGGKQEKIVNSWLYAPNGQPSFLSGKEHLRGIFVFLRFLYTCAITAYLRLGKKTDIIMYETDTVLHPAVYITYYAPWTKKLPSGTRFTIIRQLFGPRKNFVIFYLGATPRVAMHRIQLRNTTFQRHENVKDLQMLEAELEKMVNIATARGMEVVSVDTNGKDCEKVCREIENILQQKFSLAIP